MTPYPLLLVLAGCGFSITSSGAPVDADHDSSLIGDASLEVPVDPQVDALQLACATNAEYGNPHAGSTYRIATSTTTLAFDAAAAGCQTDGARLVIIDSMAENEHVAARVLGFPDWSWIGLTDRTVEGVHVWIDGTPLLPSAYRPFNGELNDGAADCYNMSPSQISGQNGRWGNFYCDQPKGWVCECDTSP